MSGPTGPEVRSGAEGDPAPLEEGGGRVVAEAKRTAVEPGDVGGFARLVANGGQVFSEQRGEQVAGDR